MLHSKFILKDISLSTNFLPLRYFSFTFICNAGPERPLISKLAIDKARPRTFDPKFDYSPARAKIFPRPNVPYEDAQRLIPQITETVSSPDEVQTEEDALRIMTDVSRLPTPLKLKYAGQPPPLDHWKRTTRAAQRTAFGHYGAKSGVDPAICWPELDEVNEQLEIRAQYERPVDQMLRELAGQKAAHEAKRQAAMKSVEKGMSKMPQMVREHLRKMRNARKHAEDADANMKKLLDEAREFFGYEPLRADLMFKRFSALRKLYDKQLATEMAGRKKVKLTNKESQRLALERSAAEIKQRLLEAAITPVAAEASVAATPGVAAASPAAAAPATSERVAAAASPETPAASTPAAPLAGSVGPPAQTTASAGKRKKKPVATQQSAETTSEKVSDKALPDKK